MLDKYDIDTKKVKSEYTAEKDKLNENYESLKKKSELIIKDSKGAFATEATKYKNDQKAQLDIWQKKTLEYIKNTNDEELKAENTRKANFGKKEEAYYGTRDKFLKDINEKIKELVCSNAKNQLVVVSSGKSMQQILDEAEIYLKKITETEKLDSDKSSASKKISDAAFITLAERQAIYDELKLKLGITKIKVKEDAKSSDTLGEDKDLSKYKDSYNVNLSEYTKERKYLEDQAKSNIRDYLRDMTNAKTKDKYKVALDAWEKFKGINVAKGCLIPPPSPDINRGMSSIQGRCREGYQSGFLEAEVLVKFVEEDIARNKWSVKSEEDIYKYAKEKCNNQARCLGRFYKKKRSMFNICGHRGLNEGVKVYIGVYFGKNSDQKDALKKARDVAEGVFDPAKFLKKDYDTIILKANKENCIQNYKINVNESNSPGSFKQCGGDNEWHCGNPDFPICQRSKDNKDYNAVGKCVASTNQVFKPDPNDNKDSNNKKFDYSRRCQCPNGKVYDAVCSDKSCTNFYCENGIPEKGSVVRSVKDYQKANIGEVVCSRVFTGATAPATESIINKKSFSMFEIPIECLINIPAADEWYRREKEWLAYDLVGSNFMDSEGLPMVKVNMIEKIRERGVKQSFGERFIDSIKKQRSAVIQAECVCGSDRFLVYHKGGYNEFMKQLSKSSFYANADSSTINTSVLDICKQNLDKLCVNGAVNYHSCNYGYQRFEHRKIEIDTKVKKCE